MNLNPNGRAPASNTHNYFSQPSNTTANSNGGKKKRTWTRAVFSSLQRKGLERRFMIQKYITKPDRKQLAQNLGLKDSQVKVWFQVKTFLSNSFLLNNKDNLI